jgi:nucleotide-binding universal stress UspA family protein
MTIRSILVPLDGSPFSEHALPAAVGVARRTGATLELVRVHEPLVPVVPGQLAAVPITPVASASAFDPRLEENHRRADESYLQSTAARVTAESGLNARIKLLDGLPGEALAARVTERGADLIVMTTHGRSGLNRLWLGSVAEGLVRHVTVPVLLVKPGERKPDASARPFRRVLIPLDGSPLSESVMEPAIEVAGADEVKYTIVRVSEPVASPSVAGFGVAAVAREEAEQMEHQINAYLDSVAERLRARGLDVERRPLLHVHAASAILHAAAEIGADLIAMATHGRGGLRRLLLGSVADKVLRGADTTVLLYRPDGE